MIIFPDPIYCTVNKRQHDAEANLQQHNSVVNRTPLADSTNERSSKKIKKSVSFGVHPQLEKVVINLENENLYVPDSVSPVSLPGYSKYHSQKVYLFAMFNYSFLKKLCSLYVYLQQNIF